MGVEETTTPELPTDPRLPGQPSVAEVAAARGWFAMRGIWLDLPTRLLSIRVGDWYFTRDRMRFSVAGAGYLVSVWLFNVINSQVKTAVWNWLKMPVFAVFTATAMYLAWRSVRAGNRRVAVRLNRPLGRLDIASALALVGRWYAASVAITVVGGAALVVVARDLPSASAALVTLVIGTVGCGIVVAGVLREPVIAEDAASRIVDDALRTRNLYLVNPAIFALFTVACADLPVGLLFAELGYLVLSGGSLLIAWILHRRKYRPLPPGNYGLPSAARPH